MFAALGEHVLEWACVQLPLEIRAQAPHILQQLECERHCNLVNLKSCGLTNLVDPTVRAAEEVGGSPPNLEMMLRAKADLGLQPGAIDSNACRLDGNDAPRTSSDPLHLKKSTSR